MKDKIEQVFDDLLFSIFSTLHEARVLKDVDKMSEEEISLRGKYTKNLNSIKATLILMLPVFNFENELFDVDASLEPKEYILSFYNQGYERRKEIKKNIFENEKISEALELEMTFDEMMKKLESEAKEAEELYKELKKFR